MLLVRNIQEKGTHFNKRFVSSIEYNDRFKDFMYKVSYKGKEYS